MFSFEYLKWAIFSRLWTEMASVLWMNDGETSNWTIGKEFGMRTYSQSIFWTRRDGGSSCLTVRGRSSQKEALEDALRDAKEFGWTKPRWWQWWRRNDQKYFTCEIP